MATKRPRMAEDENGSLEQNGSSSETTFPSFGTTAIHAGQDPNRWKSLAVTPLICMSSTFAQDKPGSTPGVSYLILC